MAGILEGEESIVGLTAIFVDAWCISLHQIEYLDIELA